MTTEKTTAGKTTTTRGRQTAAKKTTATKAVETVLEEVVEEVKVQPKRAIKKARIDNNELIPVRSTQNSLIYISKRTGEQIEWSSFGEVQDISYGELNTMKSNQKRFFTEGWIIVEDEEAIEQLGLTKQYQDLLDINDMDEFFNMEIEDMEESLEKMPRGYKKSLAVEARKRIEEGGLDSRSVIKLLEEKLDVDLKIFE